MVLSFQCFCINLLLAIVPLIQSYRCCAVGDPGSLRKERRRYGSPSGLRCRNETLDGNACLVATIGLLSETTRCRK